MSRKTYRKQLEAELKGQFEETLLSLTSSEIQVKHKLYRLEKILDDYHGYWDEWKNSEGCFLKEREVLSIEYYQKYKTHSVLASELKITPSRISAIYNMALRRLENNHHLYRHWIANKIFTKAGLHTNLDPVDQFMMRPLHEHNLSQKLYMLLSIEADNLSELFTLTTRSSSCAFVGLVRKCLLSLRHFWRRIIALIACGQGIRQFKVEHISF